jgi:hypothetical protein
VYAQRSSQELLLLLLLRIFVQNLLLQLHHLGLTELPLQHC